MCKSAIGLIDTVMMSNGTFVTVNTLVKQGCSVAVDTEFCDELFDQYSYPVYHNLMLRILNPHYICSEIALCDDIWFERDYAEAFSEAQIRQTPETNHSYPQKEISEPLKVL